MVRWERGLHGDTGRPVIGSLPWRGRCMSGGADETPDGGGRASCDGDGGSGAGRKTQTYTGIYKGDRWDDHYT